MRLKKAIQDERGIALVVALLVALVVAAISVGAAMLSTSATTINRYNERLSTLEAVAEAGLEEVRSKINGNKTLYPDSLYNTIENGVTVTDAGGTTIPNVVRYTYVGPTGITSGQYGVFGSIVSVAEDAYGNRVVKRGEISQESFAKYAYFTTVEGNIWFANNDQIWGPVHSNDRIRIYTTGATFHSTVETAEDIYQKEYATFMQGYTEWGPTIGMPTTADLDKLRVQGQAGNTAYVGNTNGGHGEATTRIEFMALDLNGDGDSTDANEGFIRVYQHLTDPEWVTGDVPADYSSRYLENADHCGDRHPGQGFISAINHPAGGHDWQVAVTSANRRCYLGGADSIWGAFDAGPDPRGGVWLPWTGGVSPLVAGRPDGAYLHPINRAMNPTFKGVIFVEGKVVISGTLRGKVTVAATDDIIIGDDVEYITDPGAGTCSDRLGIFSGDDVVIADNTLNAPVVPYSGQPYRTFDETASEFIHGTVLALNIFTVENYNSGSSNAEPCESSINGRGCIYLTGGIIQRQRGAVGLTSGRGYIKRYSYDQCVLDDPPPYFPTTGYFTRGRLFEVDPTNFDVAQYFRLLTPY
ncbi:MAG: hypothetical protein JSW51_14750 [Gemmatimonadota bacterium]|nr:MAG: hypothetical protein JSW51_14750 [Gemmatimonadota bacterium]